MFRTLSENKLWVYANSTELFGLKIFAVGFELTRKTECICFEPIKQFLQRQYGNEMKPVWIGIMKSSGSHYFDDGKEVSSFRCLYKSNFVLNPNPLSYKAISNLFGTPISARPKSVLSFSRLFDLGQRYKKYQLQNREGVTIKVRD